MFWSVRDPSFVFSKKKQNWTLVHTRKGTKNEQFWKILNEKNQISAQFSTQTPLDDYPDALDQFTIGLVGNKYTNQFITFS